MIYFYKNIFQGQYIQSPKVQKQSGKKVVATQHKRHQDHKENFSLPKRFCLFSIEMSILPLRELTCAA